MQTINYTQVVQEFFITPGRKRVAQILCQNSKGEFILGKRPYYSNGISRFLGGGIENNEEPIAGAIRELKEELNIETSASDLKELCLIKTTFIKGNEQEHLDTYVYYYNIKDLVIAPGDDVADLAYLTTKDLNQLLINLGSLTGIYPNHFARSKNISWSDWAKFHGFVLSNTIKLLG